MGESLYGTRFIWHGDDAVMFERANSRDHLWHQFSVDVQGSLGTVFRDVNRNYPKSSPSHDASMIVPTNNQHRRLRITGNDRLANYRRYDIGNCDENNEVHSDVDVHVNGVGTGWAINGSQSKYHEMVRCRYFGGKFGACAVYAQHGSFSWLGGGGSHASVAFFHIENQADTIHLHRADVETSARFAVIEGPNGQTGASQPVEIRGGRFMCDALARDDVAIWLRTAGPVEIASFQLGDGTQRVGKIVYDADHGALDVHGNKFGSFGSLGAGDFPASKSIQYVASIRANIGLNTYYDLKGESHVA